MRQITRPQTQIIQPVLETQHRQPVQSPSDSIPTDQARPIITAMTSTPGVAGSRLSQIATKPDMTRRGFLGGLFGLAATSAFDNKTSAVDADKHALEQIVGFKIAHISETFYNRVTGESVRLIYGTQGEFRADYRIAVGGRIPFEHYHAHQAEIFQMIAGKFELIIDGQTHIATPGQTITVPAGAHHDGKNIGNEEVHIIVAFDPLLDADELFARYWEICDAGHIDRFGRPDLLKLAKATAGLESETYPTNIPEGLVDLGKRAADILNKEEKSY